MWFETRYPTRSWALTLLGTDESLSWAPNSHMSRAFMLLILDLSLKKPFGRIWHALVSPKSAYISFKDQI